MKAVLRASLGGGGGGGAGGGGAGGEGEREVPLLAGLRRTRSRPGRGGQQTVCTIEKGYPELAIRSLVTHGVVM
jgi:hypothetical protein